jgi:D-amino-acid oxidase
MEIRALYDSSAEDAGVLSDGTGKIWYEKLVGGFREVKGEELKGSVFGYDMVTFLIDVPIYLGW